jgi:hypothetical protein
MRQDNGYPKPIFSRIKPNIPVEKHDRPSVRFKNSDLFGAHVARKR